MLAQIGRQIVSMCSTVVLARLLTPQDFGIIAMVTAVTGFVAMFKDMGLSMATIQRAEINHGQISTLFWINVALSIAIALLTVAIAPIIAWFYGDPRLTWITISLAIGFIFGGLTVQHQALLRRQMRFTSLAAIDITSVVFGIGVGIGSALAGAGYWALVLMQLATALSTAVGTLLICRWKPGPPQHIRSVRSMLAFGGNLTGFHVLNYFARNLDNLLIGRFFGAQQLGIYSRAYKLLLMPLREINRPIRGVVIPALSRLVDSPQRYRQTYLRILEKITILTMPGVVFMIVTSDWLVLLLLGSQWTEASRIFSLLGIAGLVQPIANTTGWLFITQDRTKHQFQWGFIGGILSVAAIIAGIWWGPVGVAASYSISSFCIQVPLLFWFVGRTGPIRTSDFYRASTPAACASLCVLLALLAFRQWVEISNLFIGLSVTLAITVLVTLSVLAVLPAGRLALRDMKSLLVLLYRRPSPSVG